jgi:hypothetical protein
VWGTVVGALLAAGWILSLAPKALTYEDQISSLARLDPPLGTHVVLPGRLSYGVSNRKLLVLLGSCSSCSMHAPDLRELNTQGWPCVVVVATAKQVGDEVKVIRNLNGIVTGDETIHKALNAYWTPRLAIVDGRGSLVALQRQGQDMNSFLQEAHQL